MTNTNVTETKMYCNPEIVATNKAETLVTWALEIMNKLTIGDMMADEYLQSQIVYQDLNVLLRMIHANRELKQ